ncbi:hypothetical protein BaRGS_00002202 [Batillaria attramentaria]|uniref:G-protein coupled receptors family 1 profile domain-containing protein n=1 Tax=Batillaria attramentaria TaxID=370345 RepID=A0ABD0M617_9CAEN
MALAGAAVGLQHDEDLREMLQDDSDNLVFRDPTDTVMDAQKITLLTILTTSNVLMLFGNGMSIYIILQSHSLQKHTYYWLVLNLAVLDLLNSLIVVPLNIIWEFHGKWPFDQMLCDFEIFLDTGFSVIAAYSTVLLSLDKYLYITKPFFYHHYIGQKMTVGSIVVTWVFWLMYAAMSVFGGLARSTKEHKYIHVLDNCNFVMKNQYAITYFVITFFFPLVILLFTSSKILCVARHHIKKIHAENRVMTTSVQTNSQDASMSSPPAQSKRESSTEVQNSFSGQNLLPPAPMTLIPMMSIGSSNSPANVSEQSSSSNTDPPIQQRSRSSSRATPRNSFRAFGTVTIVVFAYIVMFAPYCLAAVINVGCACVKPYVFEDYLAVFYYMHSLVNPYIYMATDRRYKKAIRRLLGKIRCFKNCRQSQSAANTFISSSNQ